MIGFHEHLGQCNKSSKDAYRVLLYVREGVNLNEALLRAVGGI